MRSLVFALAVLVGCAAGVNALESPAESPAPNTPPATVAPVLGQMRGRITTTTTIQTPPDALCPQWWDLAVRVGWPLEELPMLDRILWRESRCDPAAWNGHDAGLMQINQIHTEFVAVMGWSWPQDMFQPEPNLRFGLKLWQGKGWEPWGF